MAFDFPSAPSNGQVYTAPNGAQFVWQSPVWMQVAGAPLKLTARDQNILVNGAMQISQENGDAAISTGWWADQWNAIVLGAFTPSTQRYFNAALGGYGMGSQNGAVVASPGAGDYFIPAYQPIEGWRMQPLRWGTPSAIPALLNFKMTATRSGTYGCVVKTTDGSQTIGFDIPFTLGEGHKEFTFKIPANPNGSWGLNSTLATAVVAFSHTLGSSMKAAAHGVWQAANANGGPGMTNNAVANAVNFQIFNAQLLPDPDNTGIAPLFLPKTFADDLLECQRYYLSTSAYHGWSCPGATYADTYRISFPVMMRTTPTISRTTIGSLTNVASTADVYVSALHGDMRSTGVGAGNSIYQFYYTANARM